MILRHYFITVESISYIKAQRIKDGKPVLATGIISHRSVFPNPRACENKVLKSLEKEEENSNFFNDQVIVTSMNRL